jgi:hypothetical protein
MHDRLEEDVDVLFDLYDNALLMKQLKLAPRIWCFDAQIGTRIFSISLYLLIASVSLYGEHHLITCTIHHRHLMQIWKNVQTPEMVAGPAQRAKHVDGLISKTKTKTKKVRSQNGPAF